ILRRATREDAPPTSGPLRGGRLTLNPDTHDVTLDGRAVDLTAKEFELLHLVMSHPNRVFTRDFLLEHIWGYDYYGSTRTVDMHISRLREKIEDDPASPTHIVTIRGVGYKFKTDAGARGGDRDPLLPRSTRPGETPRDSRP
ncbi:MAG TPA: response regulator transcription factor, partial [bacterium]|nr:response regulator transcription factor [bacterium]